MISRRLKEAREAEKLSQEELAGLIGIEGINLRSRISNYEVGRYKPSFDFILRVAKALDYPEAYFYTVNDDFALTILEFYRNRKNKDLNPHYKDVLTLERLTSQIAEARKILEQLNECLKP